ncbi:MAG TPA: beta-propeller domain-containing protein [Pyrinomonadaceae bacterium]|nr:beta-propeller domain-containing protein [Pyrinomonadaceae bacterium]
MKTKASIILFLAVSVTIVVAAIAGCAGGTPAGASATVARAADSKDTKPKKTLRPFRSEKELKDYFRELAERQRREAERRAREAQAQANTAAPKPTSPPLGATTSKDAAPSATRATVAREAKAPGNNEESVTNVQHAGVDEGGIVKVHGNHLVVLRRGRLFTVAIGDGALRPISTADAFGPDIDPEETWYDEMLVADNTVAVIGYSYDRDGTEIGLFHLDDAGRLRYRATYHLRSDDYYSSRNYASRLIGNKLIFYAPLYLYPGVQDPSASFPALRKWHRGATDEEFRPIVSATRVYRPEHTVNAEGGLALHTVTVCDLAPRELQCQATAVVGTPGRVFYVSPESVFVWASDWTGYHGRLSSSLARRESMLYRMPLDGSAPSSLRVSGGPVDQFSFLESADAHLNVLVRSDTLGEGMWGPEVAAGDVALMRVPLNSFSDGSEAVPASSYRELPKPAAHTFQNRFVGDYLLYGTGSGWGPPENITGATLYAVQWAGAGVSQLNLAHGVDRIEAMGSDAIVVGTDGEDLHFTGVRLGTSVPKVVSLYTRKEASQGELRSHGFFYKPDGPDSGLLGLPVSLPGRPGYEHLFEESAAILFLRNESLNLKEMGELAARPERVVDDNCRASCVDWYGNARPLFLRGRVFALLGYEIVEGNLADGRIRERRRVSFAPQRQRVTRR